jgi:uncharacterized protein (DUF1330 family)
VKKGYLVVRAEVHDVGAYEVYKRLAEQAIRLFGGHYLVRGGAVERLEGDQTLPGRMAIVEFESVAQVRRFYESEEYRVARESRAGIADMELIVVEGVSLDDIRI